MPMAGLVRWISGSAAGSVALVAASLVSQSYSEKKTHLKKQLKIFFKDEIEVSHQLFTFFSTY